MAKNVKLKLSSRIFNKKRGRKQQQSGKKHCRFQANPELAASLDYKNVTLLRGFLTERGKILPSRVSGNSSFFQRKLAAEIKLARIMGLLPFCSTGY